MPIDALTMERIQRDARPILRALPGGSRVLIWGAGQLGTWLADQLGDQVVGYLDSNPTRKGTQIGRIPVYSPEQIDQLNWDRILISVLSDPGSICHWLEERGWIRDRDFQQAFPGGKRAQVLAALPRVLDFLETMEVEGGRGLEVGSGGQPWLCLALLHLGASRMVTTDVTARTELPSISDLRAVHAHLCALRPQAPGSQETVERLLARIESVPEPVSDEALPYDDDSFELICNTGVMEHITHPGVAIAEFARVLAPGGVAACLAIGIHDHRANDPRSGFHPWSFLGHEEESWRRLGSNAYHQNRWRAVQFRRAFEKSGFQILQDESIADSRLTQEMCQDFDAAFQGYSLRELSELDLWLGARIGSDSVTSLSAP